MAQVPFVHSNYDRKENDDYQTIDPRCVDAILDCVEVNGSIVDICGSHGSGIIRRLHERGWAGAKAADEAFAPLACDYVITNPPYDRKVVDDYIEHVLAHVQDHKVLSAFFLMRANWDFARGRSQFFDGPLYKGQIRMRFRPWWSEERKAQPIHNYVWHHWSWGLNPPGPRIIYWPKGEVNTLRPFRYHDKQDTVQLN